MWHLQISAEHFSLVGDKLLELKDICVDYSYKSVLRGVSLFFDKGKVYSLLGENGAGKSTLAHILCGDLRQTDGDIFLDNQKMLFKSPKMAIKKGIVCVHQSPLLSPDISIEENLSIGLSRNQLKSFVNEKEKIVGRFLKNRNPSEKISLLEDDENFFVSLTAALLKNPKVLILDEPPELPKKMLRELAESGITIIMITHHLEQALQNSDFIILLKDGKVLEQVKSEKITKSQIEQKLFDISTEIPLPDFIKKEDCSEEEIVHDFGKIGFIPADTKFTASNPELNILQLATAFNPAGRQKDLIKRAEKILEKAEVNIKLHEKASCLSGGMRQRLVLERELAENPKKLYLFNATHGLDVEATQKLYEKLKKLWNNGTEIFFCR